MSTVTIEVSQLQVGMYVHLDLGWLAHPFPLSSFKITSAAQIETIRGLGLGQLRWSPDKSDLPAAVGAASGAGTPAAGTPLVPADGTEVKPEAETPEQAERRRRREALAAQRAALLQCERQYAEATRAWRATCDVVASDPKSAGEFAQSLTRALVSKMLGDGDLCIRLLTAGAGDRASSHALNVSVISLLMGRVFGLTEAEMMDLGTGALMHDIGKIELPDRVRHLDDGFSTAEVNLYREHVSHGVSHGRRMGLTPGAMLVIAQHHEQADGNGFPQRLNVDRMTAAARIVALVNRYDNLCNPPVPSRALTPHEALSLLFAQGKHKFDATMLNAFIRMMGVYPPGSLVQLTDDRYAQVMSVNSSRPLKPRVLVHDPKIDRGDAVFLDLETADSVGIRRSVKPSQVPTAALDYLAPRQRIAYFFESVPAPAADDERP